MDGVVDHVHCIADKKNLGLIPVVLALERFDGGADHRVGCPADVEVRFEGDDMVVHGCVEGRMNAVAVFVGVCVARLTGGARLGVEGAKDVA